jgi:hypothetical protein
VQICYCMFKLCFTPSHNIKPLIPTYRPREWTLVVIKGLRHSISCDKNNIL